MEDAAKGTTETARAQDVRAIAILADIGPDGFEESVTQMVREAMSRRLRPFLVPALQYTTFAEVAALVPDLAGIVTLSEMADMNALSAQAVALVSVRERAVIGARFDQVVLDTETAGFRVAEYVASAGRTAVALVGSCRRDTPLAQGFAKGVDTYDLTLPKDFVIDCDPSSEAAAATFRAFLRTASAFPQVIYCTGPAIACGVFEALLAGGFKVPKDLWVLSQGETAMTRSPLYDVTAMAASANMVCAAALDLLCMRLDDMDGARIIRHIDFDIVAKSTTEHFYMTKAVP